MQYIVKIVSVVLLATATLGSQSALADWETFGPTGLDPQNVVIVVSENPRSNPESTCLAVTLANALTFGPRPQNVTLFATLDGVALGLEAVVGSPRFKCTQSDGSKISLQANLETFLNGNQDNLVLCPICYKERFGDEPPTYGVRPGSDGTPGSAVIDVLANADKVIDF